MNNPKNNIWETKNMKARQINTVTGPVSTNDLGITLVHEHIVFGYPGWECDRSIAPFEPHSIVKTAVNVFEGLKKFGLRTYVDATPNDAGRCPEIYKEVAENTGINIICSTGFYYEGEGMSTYWKLRSIASDICQEICELFVKEITVGIRDTGIKAGVIKVGSSKGEITDYEKIVFQAAGRAQKETGVPVITHTQEGTMGPDQARLLIETGADPQKIQIGHMSDNLSLDYQQEVFEQGVYVSWDRMGFQGLLGCPMDDERYPVMAELIKKGYADRLLLSHDSCIQGLGRPLKIPDDFLPLVSDWNPSHLFQKVIPNLKKLGVTDDQIQTIIEDNPRRLFEGR